MKPFLFIKLKVKIVITAIVRDINDKARIESLLPVWIDVYIAVDKVWVFPEIFPATIIVAPNSLIDLINPINIDEISPVLIEGKIT